MKKRIQLAIFLLFSTQVLFAQTTVQNGEFENWTDELNIDGWEGLNINYGIINIVTFSRTSDAHSGNYAAKIVNTQFLGEVIPGFAFSGDLTIDPGTLEVNFNAGFKVEGKPTQLTGFYKNEPVEGDTAGIFVGMFKWNEEEQDLDSIGGGFFISSGLVSVYSPFSVNIEYFIPDVEPDTMYILMLPALEGFHAGSALYVDDLVLNYQNVVVNDQKMETEISVFPNPANQLLHIRTASINTPCQIEMTDILGHIVYKNFVTGNDFLTVDLLKIPEGIYLLTFKNTENSICSKKILVKK